MPASDRAALRDQLATIVREAGDVARIMSSGDFKKWTKGKDASPVSDGDIAVNALLQAKLPELVPGSGWLSEETEDNAARTGAPSVWIVDPIDGTRAYISGRADWTISVALIESGRPVLAALYAPVTDEMFLATTGDGATLNGKRLRVSAGESLAEANVAGPQRYLKQLTDMQSRIQAQPKVFSLALRFARVAQGALDAAFASRGSHDWDLAAADLIVHEAGGVMTDFADRPLRYNQAHVAHDALVAAGPARHQALIDLVRDRQGEFA
ncbi:MAG TPA: 3'(2'),5'-bisphosphate nucleotidase CysQ [Pseudolabrys sp.]|nr:3'(2'),5'-bisphosphate nucleotidase CysQ [Pseudolabrys sp.]